MEVAAGRKLPDSFIDDYREELRSVVKRELKPVRGVRAALDGIDLLKCVASNGPREKIELALEVSGLEVFFGDRIFSAYDVNAWKPDPRIFLHAAGTLGVPAEQCIVIEDSALGVQAAMAAGMKVIEYAPGGGSFGADETIRRMDQLSYVLASLRQN